MADTAVENRAWRRRGGNELKVTLCAAHDGVPMVEGDGHVYVPARWLAQEFFPEEVEWFRKTEEQIRETADGVTNESYRGQK